MIKKGAAGWGSVGARLNAPLRKMEEPQQSPDKNMKNSEVVEGEMQIGANGLPQYDLHYHPYHVLLSTLHTLLHARLSALLSTDMATAISKTNHFEPAEAVLPIEYNCQEFAEEIGQQQLGGAWSGQHWVTPFSIKIGVSII